MASLSITVNNRDYHIACDDGQEERLNRLASYIDGRLRDIKTSMGIVSDNMLLVLLSLMLADEMEDLKRQMSHTDSNAMNDNGDHHAVAEIIRTIADQAEATARRLEAA